jgi:hypothetical protein
MPQRARIVSAILATAVAVLAIALVVVIVQDGTDDDGMPGAMAGNASYMGMMQAMGSMDSEAMLGHMREVLGDDAYQRMVQHFRDHRSGGAMMGNTAMDAMMHQMMDGMMQQMPVAQHHLMPHPTLTATPGR